MKRRLAIIGGGDFGQQIAHYSLATNKFEIVGFYDDVKNNGEQLAYGRVLGKVKAALKDFEDGLFAEIIIAIGYNHMEKRKSIFEDFSEIPKATIVHPTALVESSAVIKEGSVIFPGVLIDKDVIIGENVLINVHSTISHDTEIEPHCFLSPRVALAGYVHVGENCVLGINSTVIDNIKLCTSTRLAAGAVLINDTTKPGLYAGVPAQFKKL